MIINYSSKTKLTKDSYLHKKIRNIVNKLMGIIRMIKKTMTDFCLKKKIKKDILLLKKLAHEHHRHYKKHLKFLKPSIGITENMSFIFRSFSCMED